MIKPAVKLNQIRATTGAVERYVVKSFIKIFIIILNNEKTLT